MSLMITTSQHASPSSLDHPLKAGTTRAAMYAASHIGLRTRASFNSPLGRLHRKLRAISESPVSNIAGDHAKRLKAPDSESESEQSSVSEEPFDGANVPVKHSNHTNALPRDILVRIFDFYAENLWLDVNYLPFASLETLLLVCSRWRDVAEQHGAMWAKFHIVLFNQRDVGRWLTRIRRRRGRISAHTFMDISIRDGRDLSSCEPPTDPSGLSNPAAFLAHLNDLVSLITELEGNMDNGWGTLRWRSFRLAMPSNFPEVINQLDGDAKDVACSHLNSIFPLKMLFLESLELENVGWISPTDGSFAHSQLPPIFQWFITSIKVLDLYNCHLPTLPMLDGPHRLHLEYCSHWNGSRKQWETAGQRNDSNDLIEMQVWTDLQTLTIGPLTAPIVPLYLPSLRTFEIIVWWGHEHIALTHISTLSLESLHTLIISWPDTRFAHLSPPLPTSTQLDTIKNGITDLFANARVVKVIEAPRTILVSILSLLHEHASTLSPFRNETRHLILYEKAHKLRISLTGDESAKQLKDIALRHFHLTLPYWHSTSPMTGIATRRVNRGTSVDLEPIFGDIMSDRKSVV